MWITYHSTWQRSLNTLCHFRKDFLFVFCVLFGCERNLFSLCKSKIFQVVPFLSILPLDMTFPPWAFAVTLPPAWNDLALYPLSSSYLPSNFTFSVEPTLAMPLRIANAIPTLGNSDFPHSARFSFSISSSNLLHVQFLIKLVVYCLSLLTRMQVLPGLRFLFTLFHYGYGAFRAVCGT